MKQKLEEMVSESCYNEIIDKIKKHIVDEEVEKLVIPVIVKAIEDGDINTREHILRDWLDCDTCRVCCNCGEIMEEGWYDENLGYDCSDECAAKRRGMTMDEFKRYRIYKPDVEYAATEDGVNLEELTQEEVDEYIEGIVEDCDSCYTQWY